MNIFLIIALILNIVAGALILLGVAISQKAVNLILIASVILIVLGSHWGSNISL